MASNPINKEDPAYIGNELFRRKEYEKALDEYSKSIEKHPDNAKLYSNRATTYWKLNRPYDAWKDAEAGLKIEPTNEKLIYRQCTALLEMRRFHEADQSLNEGLKRIGRISKKYEKEFKTVIDDMDRMKKEFVNGRYDLPAMMEESNKSSILRKHADYYAWNKFEIREIEGKGRGLVAKDRIELGELLIACEAFFFLPRPQHTPTMVEAVRKQLSNRPDLAEQFYRLHAGKELGHLENWKEGESESELVDLERIEAVFTHNVCFDRGVFLFDGQIEIVPPKHTGLYLIPSYINHTCVDENCARYVVGDFVFIRATKVIEKGEELLIVYMPVEAPHFQRESFCTMLGFTCRCRYCRLEEREDSVEFAQLLSDIRSYQAAIASWCPGHLASDLSTGLSVTRLERYIAQLRKYRPGPDLDPFTLTVRESLASSVLFRDPKASIPMWKQLIKDYKSVGDYLKALFLTKFFKHAAEASGCQREHDEAITVAREIAKMFLGDERVADLKWKV